MKKIWENYSYTIILIGIFFISTILIANQNKEINHEDYYTVTIQQGDTLWKIAETFNNEHDFTHDEFIAWVKSENEIKDYIYPGDSITIPVKIEQMAENHVAANNQQLEETKMKIGE